MLRLGGLNPVCRYVVPYARTTWRVKVNPLQLGLKSQSRMMHGSGNRIARIMLPDDANVAGNVHGGTILKMIDEAGSIAALRHCNKGTPESRYVALCRIQHMDFNLPIYIGDLAEIEAQVSYASQRSMEVHVKVYAENLHSGERRCTNEARLWYVGLREVQTEKSGKALQAADSVPQMQFASKEEEDAGKARYEEQKNSRSDPDSLEPSTVERLLKVDDKSGMSVLSQIMLPSDCFGNHYVQGGVVMKLMDSCAGVAAYRWCKTNVVTASLETLNFEKPIQLGNLVEIFALPTYASSKSLEVEVLVRAQNLRTGLMWNAVSAHLTFVSLDANHKTLPIPALRDPEGEIEEKEREYARHRYERRKAMRAARTNKN